MSYCINPNCPNPTDTLNTNNRLCHNCNSDLLLQGSYRVVQLLGGGGFGTTYVVDDQGTAKVLKILNLHRFDTEADKEKAIELFQQEARVLSSIRHIGIPRVEADGYFTFLPKDSKEPLHCLVMEKIDGLNLEEWLTKRGNQPISLEQALSWLKQLVKILQELHQQQYLHRDIKPSNIMRRSNGRLVLIDFGAVREVTETYFNKPIGTGLFSPGFTPREQGEGKAVPQSDFFALGRTFVYLLTGKRPNELHENARTGQLIWQENVTHNFNPLVSLINALIEPYPGNRPKSAEDILERLKKIEEISRPPHPRQKPTKKLKKSEIITKIIKQVLQEVLVNNSARISQSQKRKQLFKQGFIGLITTYGIAVALNPATPHFLRLINLPLTAIGSLLLVTFGIFMSYLGAILFPFITSVGITMYFFYTQQRYSSALTLFWTALCLFDVSTMIKDSHTQNILIIGDIDSEHPGYYILSTLGWLQQDQLIGNFLYVIAFLIFWVSIVAGLYYAKEDI